MESAVGQFADDRCKACEHPKDEHFGYVGFCHKCPVEKRCQAFVRKEERAAAKSQKL